MRIQAENILLFPIDTVSRELEWQLIMALESSKDFGTTSIIGHKSFIEQVHRKSANCIWVGRLGTNHGTSKKDLSIVKAGNENNTSFLYLHDEGGFYPFHGYDQSLLQCHPVSTAQQAKNFEFLAWGEEQKQILKKAMEKYSNGNTVKVTGMPRFDLYKKDWDWMDEEEVKRLSNEHGDFTLVITKFGNANSSEHRAGLISQSFLKANKLIDDDSKVDDFFERWEKDQKDFSAFVKMLRKVFKFFPQKQFVIRPHPSEDSEFYRQVFGYYSNVKIIREGDIRPWIKACEAMIHTGCTTGIEGVLANKKVINYIPANQISDYDIAIACEAGKFARQPDDIIDFLETNDQSQIELSEDSTNKLYNLNHSSIAAVKDEIKMHLNENRFSKVEVDNVLIRKLKLFKSKLKKNRIANKRKLNTKETGRNVRLSELSAYRIQEITTLFNQKHNAQIKVKLLSRNFLILSPK
jgi:surface carbohydrate biosynthesis protein